MGHTFADYKNAAERLEKNRPQTKSDYLALEKEYWEIVDLNKGPQFKVEYAADVPTNVYGSGFGHKNQPIIDPRQKEYLNHPWNLNNLPRQANSLMQFPLRQDISGINIPWLYIGMKFSTFCWHYEDLMLNSINYSHWGQPKQWYAVPESDRIKFEKAVKQKVSLLFKQDPNILLDIVTMVSPAYLAQQNVSFVSQISYLISLSSFHLQVKVYKTLQYPGEFVLTLPGSYHAGFSTGLNIGEAVNFTASSWIEYGIKC